MEKMKLNELIQRVNKTIIENSGSLFIDPAILNNSYKYYKDIKRKVNLCVKAMQHNATYNLIEKYLNEITRIIELFEYSILADKDISMMHEEVTILKIREVE